MSTAAAPGASSPDLSLGRLAGFGPAQLPVCTQRGLLLQVQVLWVVRLLEFPHKPRDPLLFASHLATLSFTLWGWLSFLLDLHYQQFIPDI